ncbi:MAG: hypothetical protein ACYDBH_17165 [Acidobacteriaceae bacterium]
MGFPIPSSAIPTGVHRNDISPVERAEIPASVVPLASMAAAFGLRPGVLVDGHSESGMNPAA